MPLVLGKDVGLSMSCESAGTIELPVAFAGYALSVPEQDYDDPKSIDLKGKLALYLGGGPATVTEPRREPNRELRRILIGLHDYYRGLDAESLQVTVDFPIDDAQPGENLAKRFKPKSDGVLEFVLAKPITNLPRGVLTVSVKDKQGNIARIERTIEVTGASE